MHTTPLILDVDTGIDDSLALLYAAASPEIELVGATCVGGNTDADQVARNTRGVLDVAGRHDVPVVVGRRRPIARPLVITPETHGPAGIGYAEFDGDSAPPDAGDGVEFIVESARQRPGEITLVNLGPLTNLASAVLAEPRLPELLAGVYVMGGCFRHSGNTGPRTEWNVHVDPEAAKVVYANWSERPADVALPVIMGLDVTEEAMILPEHLRELASAIEPGTRLPEDAEELMAVRFADPVLRLVIDALRFYFEFHATYDGFYGAHIHDPYVVSAAADPDLVSSTPVFVDVEVGGTLTAGEVVADWRHRSSRSPNARVVEQGDAQTFLRRLIERLPRLPVG